MKRPQNTMVMEFLFVNNQTHAVLSRSQVDGDPIQDARSETCAAVTGSRAASTYIWDAGDTLEGSEWHARRPSRSRGNPENEYKDTIPGCGVVEAEYLRNNYRYSLPRLIPNSFRNSSLRLLPSLRYIHSPDPLSCFWFMPSPITTQSYRLGPLTGDDNHICLFGGCLFSTYVPDGGKMTFITPCYTTINPAMRQMCSVQCRVSLTLYSTSMSLFSSARTSKSSSMVWKSVSDCTW